MSNKIAVVSGSNKGIGLSIVRELCKREVGVVYLTARDVARGQKAIEKLKSEGLNPKFHQLDVSDIASVKMLADHIKENYGGFDILINNAAIAPQELCSERRQEAHNVINVNYRSITIVQEYLFPILNDNGRVINISSNCGLISNLKNTYWIKKLTKEDICIQDIEDFIRWFLNSVDNGTLNNDDFTTTLGLSYIVSKIAVNAITKVQQKEVGRGISVNSLHPGVVLTDMTNKILKLEDFNVENAAKTPVYLALDVDQSLKGKFIWHDKTEIDWCDPTLDLYFKAEEYS